eukprot:CAMPEP_0195517398 /NCGR_PEP_ID=MMETSP0794_2-20130614/10686_1 /TAXON_ID=515487 /ORGANISM="Stephanopyxis turris, Strain CCMP 815" /LENGTH=561 /DNA_ID=CAMNT_0040646201 /DNA_START=169 /DNA_END=1854 /DNA_ORIENTATION=-
MTPLLTVGLGMLLACIPLVCSIQPLDSRNVFRGFGNIIQDDSSSSSSFLEGSKMNDDDKDDVREDFVTQMLDHFATNPNHETATFQQRYFYTSRYVVDVESNFGTVMKGDDDVVRPSYAFLCVGGEGPPLQKAVLIDSVHCTGDMIELAKRLYDNGKGSSVHLFALEHRYYGKSYPSQEKSTSDSKVIPSYLSSRQALADLSHFVTVTNQELIRSSPNNLKWVTFGGSYPGMLAGWARLRLPHLIHAAVSNSAPMQAKLDFGEYQATVSADLRYELIGGSSDCLEIMEHGHAELSRMLTASSSSSSSTTEDRTRVAELFQVCGGVDMLKNDRNVEMFIGDGVMYVPSQANDPSCDGELCNIEKLCSAMLEDSTSSPMERLAHISNRQRNSECINIDWSEYLLSIGSNQEDFSWLWQTCTEFGFYQTCENDSGCPFSEGFHTVEQDLEMCKTVYGIDSDTVKQNIQDTLEWYGGWDIKGSRIMFVNGDVDPWSALAVTGDRGSPDQPTLWVKGASHHAWTHKVKESDSEEIVQAREDIYTQVTEWLMEPLWSRPISMDSAST